MNGKINIVFGFIYFACTALLGPTVLVPQFYKNMKSFNDTGAVVEKVREGAQGDFKGADIAPAVVSIFDYMKTSAVPPAKAAHVHGNLESLLNIVAGFILLTLAIPANFKTLLSIVFLIGAVFHSGMLYLGGVFHMYWAYNLAPIGAIAIIVGLLGMGVASFIGLKQK